MKKLIFIIYASACFADNYKLLEIQKEIINEKIQKYEIQKELGYSQAEFLSLKKELFDKNLEIIDEKIKITKEYYEKTTRLEELSELEKISNLKISNLKKIKELQLELKKSISENEFFDLENQILEEDLAIKLYIDEEKKIRFILANNSFLLIKHSDLSYYEELLGLFETYINQKEQELKLAISERGNDFEIEMKRKELDCVKINFKEKLFEFEKYNLDLKVKLKETSGNLDIIKLKIDNTNSRLKNMDNLLKCGAISQNDFFKEKINLLGFMKEQTFLLGIQNSTKSELEIRNTENANNTN